MSLINTQVQPFKATAFHNGKFVDVSDESLRGKWSIVTSQSGVEPAFMGQLIVSHRVV